MTYLGKDSSSLGNLAGFFHRPPVGSEHPVRRYRCTGTLLSHPTVGVALLGPKISDRLSSLTLLEPQSRFGDKPLKLQVVCPQNGTAVLKGLSEEPAVRIKKNTHVFVSGLL